jgi:hypothetical protein
MTHFSIRSRAAAAAGAVLVLTLGACSGGTGGTGAGGGTSGTGSTRGTAATPSAEASKAPLAPLDAFFATMYGDKDAAKSQQTKYQESIAACMTTQGFRYKPVVDPGASGGTAASSDNPDLQWGTKEYAAQYGYGAVASAIADPTQGPSADPNQDYVNAMSETEKKAYHAALSGTGNPKLGYNWQTAGCQGAAQHEAGLDVNQHAALQDEMTAMDKSIDSDPRVRDVNAKWAACMAGAGYADLKVVGDAEQSIEAQVQQVEQAAYAHVDQSKLTPAKTTEIEATIKAQLAPLTSVEIKTAVADFTCRDDVTYTRTHQDVTIEYQQKFMDTHKAELDAWMEASLAANKK